MDNINNEVVNDDVDYDGVKLELPPLLEEFLDASSYEDKLEVFYKMRNVADEKMLSNVAMSLDIQISKETVEEQYQEILYCLRTMEKFECNRLRSDLVKIIK